MLRTHWCGGGQMSVALETVSGLHEVLAWQSCCLLIHCVHRGVILLANSGGIVGWGTARELSGLCSLTWHSGRDRQV
jgi:hypothetical protein